MPKTKVTQAEERRRRIRADINGNMERLGYRNDDLVRILGISVSTLCSRKRDPDTLTLGEIRKMEKLFGYELTDPFRRRTQDSEG